MSVFAIVKTHVEHIIENQKRKERLETQVEVIALHRTRESAVIGLDKILEGFSDEKFRIVKKENLYQIIDIEKKFSWLFGPSRPEAHLFDFEIIETQLSN